MKRCDYLSRSQLQAIHNLGSPRNTSRVLKDMSRYVTYFRDGEAIYYLTKEGRELVNAKKVRKKTLQARHFIMRNSLYIAYGCPETWKNEVKLELPNRVKAICDALFSHEGCYYIIEVDHTQTMLANKTKMSKYRKLIDLGVFDREPAFIWITTTEYRSRKLEELCEGLDVKVFTISDFI